MKLRSVLAFFISVLISVKPLTAQSPKNFYIIGLHMGFASFRASLAANETDMDRLLFNLRLTESSLNDAFNMLPIANTRVSPLYALDANELRKLIALTHNYYFSNAYFEYLKEGAQIVLAGTNSIRDAYSASIAGVPRMPQLAQSYMLGINLAIAEGQATVGDEARTIVVAALNNAKNEAISINKTYATRGLDLAPLNECISMAAGTTPMTEVYAKILSLRNGYQATFGNY